MTKLDLVLARLKDLPPEQQDMIAVEIEFMIDHDFGGEGLLTDEQWADLRQRAEQDQGPAVSHDEIVAEFLPSRVR